MVPLKYLSNFWRTLEMTLINFEINHNLTWSANCVVSNVAVNQATAFAITDSKRHVPVVTLLTQDNAKLLQQLKSGFKRTINSNKYQTKVSTERQNQYINFLIDPSFQAVNRLFALSFENGGNRKVHSRHYLPKREIKDYSAVINGKILFDQLKMILEHLMIL